MKNLRNFDSSDVKMVALKRNGNAIMFIEHPSETVQMAA